MKIEVFQVKDQTILENSFHEPFIKISNKKIEV